MNCLNLDELESVAFFRFSEKFENCYFNLMHGLKFVRTTHFGSHHDRKIFRAIEEGAYNSRR